MNFTYTACVYIYMLYVCIWLFVGMKYILYIYIQFCFGFGDVSKNPKNPLHQRERVRSVFNGVIGANPAHLEPQQGRDLELLYHYVSI